MSESDKRFLTELFEFEWCAECGGDDRHHVVTTDVLGNPFAYCMYPMNDQGEYHPAVAQAHAEEK